MFLLVMGVEISNLFMKNDTIKPLGISYSPRAIIIIYLLYIFLIALDVVTTYIATPDLNLEYNPAIAKYELTWTQIIIISFAGGNLLFFLFYFALQKIKIFNNLFTKVLGVSGWAYLFFILLTPSSLSLTIY